MRTITVIGSVNMDLVATSVQLPRTGETVIGRVFTTSFGGKGANQAHAAVRMGAKVRFIGCVGDDEHGKLSRENLRRSGIDVRGLKTVKEHTGVALVLVDATGNNQICVVPGANERACARGTHDIALMQLETPFELPRAKLVILNPAPARKVPLKGVDIVIPNEIEAEQLTGKRDPTKAALALERMGAGRAIITLGERGVFDGKLRRAFRVKVLDTVGAGDAFVGAFAAAIATGIEDPVEFAQAAAALKVMRRGARCSASREDVMRFLKSTRTRR